MTELKPCPFCGGKEITMEGFDFGRNYIPSEHIDTETEAITFICGCGCSMDVPVDTIEGTDEKIEHAKEIWNTRVKE